jgi:hypothetical protein
VAIAESLLADNVLPKLLFDTGSNRCLKLFLSFVNVPPGLDYRQVLRFVWKRWLFSVIFVSWHEVESPKKVKSGEKRKSRLKKSPK